MTVEFFVECVPPTTTAQQKGQNRKTGAYYKPESLLSAQTAYEALLRPHKSRQPLSGALELEVLFSWPWRAREPKRLRVLGAVPMTTKPDADNVVKQFQDVLKTLGFFEDDAAVSDLIVRKRWGMRPGISVRITELDEAGDRRADEEGEGR